MKLEIDKKKLVRILAQWLDNKDGWKIDCEIRDILQNNFGGVISDTLMHKYLEETRISYLIQQIRKKDEERINEIIDKVSSHKWNLDFDDRQRKSVEELENDLNFIKENIHNLWKYSVSKRVSDYLDLIQKNKEDNGEQWFSDKSQASMTDFTDIEPKLLPLPNKRTHRTQILVMVMVCLLFVGGAILGINFAVHRIFSSILQKDEVLERVEYLQPNNSIPYFESKAVLEMDRKDDNEPQEIIEKQENTEEVELPEKINNSD